MRILFGISAPSLAEQLKNENIDSVELDVLDKDYNAIDRLSARGYISNRQRNTARKLLLTRIPAHIKAW